MPCDVPSHHKAERNESLKAYLAQFNKECMIVEDQDERITLAALLGGVWPQSTIMVELAKSTPEPYESPWTSRQLHQCQGHTPCPSRAIKKGARASRQKEEGPS